MANATGHQFGDGVSFYQTHQVMEATIRSVRNAPSYCRYTCGGCWHGCAKRSCAQSTDITNRKRHITYARQINDNKIKTKIVDGKAHTIFEDVKQLLTEEFRWRKKGRSSFWWCCCYDRMSPRKLKTLIGIKNSALIRAHCTASLPSQHTYSEVAVTSQRCVSGV